LRLAIPILKAEDAVGFGNHMPAFDIGDGRAMAVADPDMLVAELGSQGFRLFLF
jgi:hypothetical protein